MLLYCYGLLPSNGTTNSTLTLYGLAILALHLRALSTWRATATINTSAHVQVDLKPSPLPFPLTYPALLCICVVPGSASGVSFTKQVQQPLSLSTLR